MNVFPEGRNADAKAAHGNRTWLDERLRDRGVGPDVGEVPQDIGQSISSKRASAVKNEFSEDQRNKLGHSPAVSGKSVGAKSFSEVHSDESAPTRVHSGGSTGGVHPVATVDDAALPEDGRQESRPTAAAVKEPVGEFSVSERLVTGMTDVSSERSVSRTHKDSELGESQHRTFTAATRRDQHNDGAAASDSREHSLGGGDQAAVTTEHQREAVQQVVKGELGVPRSDLHHSATSSGEPVRGGGAEQGVNSGGTRLRDGAQPGVVAATATSVNEAQPFAHKEHAEMHIGLRTPESGRVEVHTVLHAGQTETIIAVEKGSVRDALLAEMPGVQSIAREQHVNLGRLTVVETGTMASLGSGNSGGGNSEWRDRRFTAGRAAGVPDGSESNELEPITADGLSIHV